MQTASSHIDHNSSLQPLPISRIGTGSFQTPNSYVSSDAWNTGTDENSKISALSAGKDPGELVFSEGICPPRPKSTNGWFRRAVARAKLKMITPHDLRHTAASLALSAGVSVLTLARMLGHKDPSATSECVPTSMWLREHSTTRVHSPDQSGLWAQCRHGLGRTPVSLPATRGSNRP